MRTRADEPRPHRLRRRSHAGTLLAAIAVGGAGLGTGCQTISESAPPVWVQKAPSEHPTDQYLTSVGTGPTRNDALETARSELMRGLEAEVSAHEEKTWLTGPEGIRPSRGRALDPSGFLAEAEIVAAWTDPAHGGSAVQVALNRANAARVCETHMMQAAAEVQAKRELARNASSSWARFQHLGAALPPARIHDEWALVRAAVAPRLWDGDEPGRLLVPEIQSEQDEARDRLVTVIEAPARAPEGIETIVRDAIRSLGVPVDGQRTPTVRAILSYDAVRRPFRQRRGCLMNWTLDLELVAAETGDPIGRIRFEGEGWGDTCPQAIASAAYRARQRAAAEVRPRLLDLIGEAEAESAGTARVHSVRRDK